MLFLRRPQNRQRQFPVIDRLGDAVTYHIYELQIPDAVGEAFETDSKDRRLRRLSRLNVFIGPNNSGKSRLLRELFAQPTLSFSPFSAEAVDVRRRIDEIVALDLPKHVHQKLSVLVNQFQLPLQNDQADNLSDQKREQVTVAVARYFERHSIKLIEYEKERGIDVMTLFRTTAEALERLYSAEPAKCVFNRIYIPTLRGLRPPSGDPYYFRKRTYSDYFAEAKQLNDENADRHDLLGTRIFTGLEVFEELQNFLLGTLEQREKVRMFEVFLGDTFYGGKSVSLIPRRKEKALHVKIGDEAERPIWWLGDGIQQTIILTLPIFLHSDSQHLLFVEEPELFLHPGFQRIWIETVLKSKGSLQVFVATHSHQFMDITVDTTRCSIYKLTGSLAEGDGREREARHRVSFTSNSDFSVLRELGVRNSSVLLSNCTIWVEGITDRLYLRKYLNVFQADENLNPSKRQFVEDLHYSFVEYGGSTITHFSFLDHEEGINVDRLCGELFLVADRDTDDDSETSDGKKAERRKRLQSVLGERCKILDCVEIENLLTPEVIAAVVQEYERDAANLNDFRQTDYQGVRLGEFIEEKVMAGKSSRKSANPYRDDSGTLKDKPGFCARATRKIDSSDHLSPQAVELTRAIYNHIARHNS